MKKQINQILVKSGIWYPLNLLRKVPAILRWLGSGGGGVAPHPIKMMVVKSYLIKFSLGNFIETGTYLGETLGYVANLGVHCASIELSQGLYEAASRRFSRQTNVRLVQGDSGQKLPELLRETTTPVLFWLDGHYSSGVTASAGIHTPISTELQAILNHPIKQHVILIDDARLFDGTNAYPHLDQLLQVIRENGRYSVEVSTDIIRLTPLVPS